MLADSKVVYERSPQVIAHREHEPQRLDTSRLCTTDSSINRAGTFRSAGLDNRSLPDGRSDTSRMAHRRAHIPRSQRPPLPRGTHTTCRPRPNPSKSAVLACGHHTSKHERVLHACQRRLLQHVPTTQPEWTLHPDHTAQTVLTIERAAILRPVSRLRDQTDPDPIDCYRPHPELFH
jgi:hypothetical protein